MSPPPIGPGCRAIAAAAFATLAVHAAETPGQTAAERLLEARQSEFERAVIQVAEGVHTAVGFGVSPSSMIVGETGVVIVDTQIDAGAARGALAAFREITEENPAHLVGGHTRPVLGRERVREVLTNYRDGIRSVFEQTIAGMNRGLTPDQLVEAVQVPPELAALDYLRPYYGHPAWAVRSIFTGYLGWFDGNPTSLFPLSPAEEAARIAELAGGIDVLRERAAAALATDPQWTAELCDRVLALDAEDTDAMELKADALEALARPLLTATGRNYYLTVAMQLRARARGEAPGPRR